MKHNILITGGAGFIGSHVVRLFVNKYSDYKIYNLDVLTYAANLKNLTDIENKNNYNFIKADICDFESVKEIFIKYKINKVIHFAAESHVDRSIKDPFSFAKTNVMGTLSLLQAAKEAWSNDYSDKLFYHISTDEVYGSLNQDELFTEITKYDPHSPYAASKASSDHFVRAFSDTFGMPIVISNCSNNYGPYQFPEKLIPLVILNALEGKKLPIYGNGNQIRDWLYVDDHARALLQVAINGKVGETYNIGGHNEMQNIEVVKVVCGILDELAPSQFKGINYYEELITYVDDRSGHDVRYAINTNKIEQDLGWKPEESFETGILKTVQWYLDNKVWHENIQNGSYQRERLGVIN